MEFSKLMGYACMSGGALLPVLAAYARHLSKSQRDWVKTSGKVISSCVVFEDESYRADVRYRYICDGREYFGTKVRSLELLYNFKGPAKKTCARYPNERDVDVFVNPVEPSRAVLEPGGDPKVLPAALITAFVLIAIGWVLVEGQSSSSP